MAKVIPNINVQRVAGMAGVKAPNVPKVPKAPKKKADQLKKEASARAKNRAKAMLRIAIMAGVAAAIGFVVYFVKFHGRQPKDAFEVAVEAAYRNDTLQFRDVFTEDSIAFVENAEGDSTKNWEHLMEGISPVSEHPKVKKTDITENKDIKSAELTVDIEGEEKKIYMRQEDGAWKINLNVALNPKKVTLPDNIPAKYIDNFNVSDEPEAWWETTDKKKNEEEGSKSFLSKLKFWEKSNNG